MVRWRRRRSGATASASVAGCWSRKFKLPSAVKSSGAVSRPRGRCHKAAGHDPGEGRAGDHAKRGAPARIAQGQGGLAQRMGHQAHHLLGVRASIGTISTAKPTLPARRRNGPSASQSQSRRKCPPRWTACRSTRPPRTAQSSRRGPTRTRRDRGRSLYLWQTDQRGESDDNQGPDNRVRQATARLSGRRGFLTKKFQSRDDAPFETRCRESGPGQGRHERQHGHERGHGTADDTARRRRPFTGPDSPRPSAATRQIRRRARALTTR